MQDAEPRKIAVKTHADFPSCAISTADATARVEIPETLIHRDVIGIHTPHPLELSTYRGHLRRDVKLPSRVVSVAINELLAGEATPRHRHNYETVIYILSGAGMSLIEEVEVRWTAGDALYVPVLAWHQHRSLDQPVRYLTCENAPMLQTLGIPSREESLQR
jgi:quercetin dioxygenase-like cupin family protein